MKFITIILRYSPLLHIHIANHIDAANTPQQLNRLPVVRATNYPATYPEGGEGEIQKDISIFQDV